MGLDWNETSNNQSTRRFTSSNDRKLRQPNQSGRDADTRKSAIGYDPNQLLNEVFGKVSGASTTGAVGIPTTGGGAMVWVVGFSILILISIMLSTATAWTTDLKFLPCLGKCYYTTFSFILISTGLYGLKKWA